MSEPGGFSDADIRVGDGLEAGRYLVAIETAAGDASGLLQLDPADESFRQSLHAIEDGETDEGFFFAFGECLFDALLPDPVAATFRAALGRAHGDGKRLRLRLRLRPPELSALPWEFLYDPQQDLFLGISSKIVLSRYVVDTPTFVEPMAVPPPLRLLVAFSDPAGVMPLNLDREREVVTRATRQAVEAGRLELHFLDHTTNATLRSTLRDVRPHILHFVGHGEFDGQHGYLLFEDEAGKARRVRDRTLREFFEDAPDTRLVVLNACQGATTSTGQAISGLAPNLVQRGLPAVVAMRYPIPDDTAIVFAGEFYQALTHETPAAVDVAVANGRRAIYQDVDPARRDWGIPNVFLRADDGTIFAPPKADADRAARGTEVQVGNISNVSGSTIVISGGDVVTGNEQERG
jgi:hypothetical protein